MKKLKQWRGLAFVLPSLIGIIIFYLGPFVLSLMYCVTSGVKEKKFIGLNNFIALFHNDAYKLAVKNTIHIIGLGILIVCISAFIIALVIEENLRKYRFLQCIVLIPMAIPTASMMLVWQDLFKEGGILNILMGQSIDFLDTHYATYIIVGIIVWKNVGYAILLMTSTLLTLPNEYVEAARLEGASWYQITLHIKVPQIVPMLFFMVIISLWNSFKIFREVYLLQGDYPNEELYMLQHFMNNNFVNLNYQMITTAAFTMYIVIFVMIGLASKWQQRYKESIF
ncbi:MAG: sugar ABC transporter permease [Cellulosilyticum sp.]|nr:sugar ABC transporter permease [Cellulosilyticum sp.]